MGQEQLKTGQGDKRQEKEAPTEKDRATVGNFASQTNMVTNKVSGSGKKENPGRPT